MTGRRNVLWIMCDQLRFDYLGCAGHPHIRTPNIDRLAARGVRFTNTYVQSPICGPSRMSFYTGRYVHSHGSTWNGIPLRAGEPTLGDHLRAEGVRTVLVGKTHMKADVEGMMRLGIDPDTEIGVRISECGFEPFERDDGLHPYGPYDPDPRYDTYLRETGYEGENLWEEWANSAEDADGKILSGWLLSHADKPARIEEPDSETPYMTDRAIEFMLDNSALTRTNIEREVDRYISWPGQALGYKLGELEIRRLRALAEESLGDRFDIRDFHDQLLWSGSVPLPVLRHKIERWIETNRER